MGVLKPGDAEFDKVIKEVEELKADNRIMTPHDAEISSPITERRDFPHFSLQRAYRLVPRTDLFLTGTCNKIA